MSDIKQILGERSEAHGAYFIEMEYFKVIYRLSVRLSNNYKKEIQFMKITIKNADETKLEELKKLLIKILRKSDCLTQNGNNQIFVLLLETSANDVEIVQNRIFDKIKQSAELSDCNVEFYYENL